MKNMINYFKKYIRGYVKESVFAPILMMGEVILEIAIPYFMSVIVDEGITKGSRNLVIKIGIIVVLSAILSLLCGASSGKLAAKASTGLAKNLRRGIYENIQQFSFSNIDKFSASSLVTRLTTDVTNVQNAYQMVIRTMVRAVFMQVFCLVMVFRINRELALVFSVAIPVLAVSLFLIVKKVHPLFKKVFRIYDRLNRVVQENVRGIRVVKSYVREEHEKEKFAAVSSDVFQTFTKAEKILAFNSPIMQVVMYSCMISIFWIGARKVVGGVLLTGQLMSMISYITQSLYSLMMMSMVFVMIIISRASIVRIIEVLDEESDLHDGSNPVMEVGDGSIEFDRVSFSYYGTAKQECLSDISFSIKPGEVLGIIGETGSGKSSLVQLIPRLYDVTKGSVRVGGIDVKDYQLDVLRNEVAVVLQKNILFSGTIQENLRWGNKNALDADLIHACRLAQADGFISEFPDEYLTHIEQGGANLSGGQRQRLCIARALLKNPRILILDDSTSAVDTKTDSLIQSALKREYPNTTKIIIAQRISSVEHADKIIVLEKGRIHAVGSHEELLKSDKIYQEVYYSQKKGGDENGTAEK